VSSSIRASCQTIRDFVARWRAAWHGAEKALLKFLPREKSGDSGAGVMTLDPGTAGGQLHRHAAEALAQVGVPHQPGGARSRPLRDGDGRRGAPVSTAAVRAARRRWSAGVRMLPFAEACQGLERSVRDVARTEGKQVELTIEGGDVELDRSVL